MSETDTYLKEKQSQIDKWITELARLDALCGEGHEEERIKFELQLKGFSDNLWEIQKMFSDFERLNEESRERFRSLIEMHWTGLEENFKRSVSEFREIFRDTQ